MFNFILVEAYVANEGRGIVAEVIPWEDGHVSSAAIT